MQRRSAWGGRSARAITGTAEAAVAHPSRNSRRDGPFIDSLPWARSIVSRAVRGASGWLSEDCGRLFAALAVDLFELRQTPLEDFDQLRVEMARAALGHGHDG